MRLAKRRHKDHTRWPENCWDYRHKLYKLLEYLDNVMLKTQLNVMIKTKQKTKKTRHVPGRLYWLSAPSWKHWLLTMKKLQIPWQLLGVQPGPERADQAPWNLPSPSCTSLTPSLQRTSPRSIPQIRPFQFRWNTSTSQGEPSSPESFMGRHGPTPSTFYVTQIHAGAESTRTISQSEGPQEYTSLLKRNLKNPMTRQAGLLNILHRLRNLSVSSLSPAASQNSSSQDGDMVSNTTGSLV